MKDNLSDRALIVINPNSSTRVTEGIDRAMTPLRSLGTPIECVTLAEGPAGIESQAHADSVVLPMLALADQLRPRAAGFVVACFSDPGLHAMRERADVPVFGIMESAVMRAMMLGHRFGVIAILPNSIPRHLRAFGAMGVSARVAGDRALGLTVAELGDRAMTLDRMIAVGRTCARRRSCGRASSPGRTLRQGDGADVLIMGCAGMADYRAEVAEAVGCPVVEPCQAAAAMAIGCLALDTHAGAF